MDTVDRDIQLWWLVSSTKESAPILIDGYTTDMGKTCEEEILIVDTPEPQTWSSK